MSFPDVFIFTNSSARAGYGTGSIFNRSLTGLNSEFYFFYTSCLTKAEEPSLSYYLPIAGGRIIGFIPFSRVLVLCEMQSVSSRIWTRVVVSISYDDNHYTTSTFPKCISSKVNVIVQLELELTYRVVRVQHISHNVTGTPLLGKGLGNTYVLIYVGGGGALARGYTSFSQKNS